MSKTLLIASLMVVMAVVIEGGMWLAVSYNTPRAERFHFGKVDIQHCPELTYYGIKHTAGEKHHFDIPAGVVEESIPCFSVEAGVGFTFDLSGEASLAATPAVQGNMTTLEALKRLLAGTPVMIDPIKPSDRGIILRSSHPVLEERS